MQDEQDQPAEEETQICETAGKYRCQGLFKGKAWAVSLEASREIRWGSKQGLVERKVNPVLNSE